MRASAHSSSATGQGAGRSPRAESRSDGRIAIAIFVVALAARLIFLFNSPDRDWPHSIFYEGDAIVWVDWAIALDEGGVYQFDLPIHPPAIAYTIAWLYDGVRVTGFVGMKALWCTMSAAACALTFLACAAVMSRRVAVIATLLLVFSFNQYVLATSLNNETPYVMLVAAIVLLTQRAIARPGRWIIVAIGLSHGIAMLLRAEHPLLLVLLLVWMLLAKPPQPKAPDESRHRSGLRTRAASAAIVALTALLFCLPWTIHATLATKRFNTLQASPIAFNLAPIEWTESAQAALNGLPAFARTDLFAVLNHWAQKQGMESITGADLNKYLISEFGWIPRPLTTFVLVSNQGPFSFALANHPQADGGFSRAALAHPMRGNDPSFAFAFPPHNRVFTDGWRMGWEFLNNNRAAVAHNIRRKFERFAAGVAGGFGAANFPMNRTGVREPVDMFVSDAAAARVWRIATFALATAGIVLALVRRMPVMPWLLVILYKLAVTALFYGYARQGASIAPAFFVFIAITLDSLLQLIDRRWPRWIDAQAWFVIAIIAAMMIADVVWSRRDEHLAINGQNVPRPDLGPGPPIAFQAFNRIEILAAP